MPKFLIPKTFQVDGIPIVSIDPQSPNVGSVTFQVENELRTYQFGRQQLDRLARDIASKLKAAPPPARRGSSESEPTSNGK